MGCVYTYQVKDFAPIGKNVLIPMNIVQLHISRQPPLILIFVFVGVEMTMRVPVTRNKFEI